jgi:hypothetical protein
MSPAWQVKQYFSRLGVKVDNKNKVVTLSKRITGDSWFIKCFDSYKECLDWTNSQHNNYINNNVVPDWYKVNVK